MSRAGYARFWRGLFLAAALLAFWEQSGRVWVRSRSAPRPAPEEQRTQSWFTALVFPKVTPRAEPFTISREDFDAALAGLKSLGYAPIGLEDVRALFREGRRLPPRALLIALDRDEPSSVRLAEKSVRRHGLRAVVFLRGQDRDKGRYRRHWLSRRAIAQMRKTGAWDFGRAVMPDEKRPPSEYAAMAGDLELRFTPEATGYNDDRGDPGELRILHVRGGRPVQEILLAVHNDQPRAGELSERFAGERLGAQWTAGWGAASSSRRKLLLVPTPRQTGAAVTLTGTESWTDVALEFELERFTRNFWAYVRYKDAGHYLRVGASEKEGMWLLQQKTGALSPPAVLGQLPLEAGGLPARVKLVVKGGTALLFLNGARLFGKTLRVDPRVDFGRVQLSVHDVELRAASAVIGYVRARPLGARWLVLGEGSGAPETLKALRERAVEAAVLSPRWLKTYSDGRVGAAAGPDRELVWSFAGYYGCRVIPTVALSAADPERDAALSERLLSGLAEHARRLEGAGLNLRVPAGGARPSARFLLRLRERLRAQGRELWVTWDGAPDPAWLRSVDGVLRPAESAAPGLEGLDMSAEGAARALAAR